jgi:hypothetical protein
MPLTAFRRELCESSPFDFTDLRALYVKIPTTGEPRASSARPLANPSMAAHAT